MQIKLSCGIFTKTQELCLLFSGHRRSIEYLNLAGTDPEKGEADESPLLERGCTKYGLLGSNVQPDAPGIEAVKDAELRPCGFKTRDAAMVVACAPRARMRMRTRSTTCLLWNIVVSFELSYREVRS